MISYTRYSNIQLIKEDFMVTEIVFPYYRLHTIRKSSHLFQNFQMHDLNNEAKLNYIGKISLSTMICYAEQK